ncbi:hypothetical protein O0I10_005074 [Lichtheimia ornata]|uniref:Uncharacterized protein n=1 Tax=Lichtheimia ornata TaxID=688661 RepID=A0AAD7XW78_9FUNG|nr:uncharacterized protein O0I10_005074 [Lichtheimia ornata]KAJ8659359.1 hypothetical protein O0I10_005074 [Lichtheimia ornata]
MKTTSHTASRLQHRAMDSAWPTAPWVPVSRSMSQTAQKIFFGRRCRRGRPSDPVAGSDIAKSGIGKLDRETFTQGAVGQADSTLH